MAGRWRLSLGATALVLAAGAMADAQTNDLYFRGWAWTADTGTVRSMGMADANVALRDDLSALQGNPAGLASLERNEVSASLAGRAAGRTSTSDRILARASLGHVAAAARFGPRWAFGVHATQPQATRIDMVAAHVVEALGGIGTEAGKLDAVTTDLGAALALRAGDRLLLGGRLAVARFDLESEYTFIQEPARVWRTQGAGGWGSIVLGSIGAQVVVSRALRLGSYYSHGGAWELERRDVSPVLGLNLDEGSTFAVRRPSVAAAGVAWHRGYGTVLLFQVERLGFGPLRSVPPLASGDLPFPAAAWRERIGLEHSWALDKLALQLRMGVLWSGQPSKGLWPLGDDSTSDAPSGERGAIRRGGVHADAYSALGQATGDWAASTLETLEDPRNEPAAVTCGASVVIASGSHLDVAVRASRLRVVASLGLSLRF